MKSLALILLSIVCLAFAEGSTNWSIACSVHVDFVEGAKNQQRNDEMMKNLQKFLMEAEKEGKADKPMMIKEVDGKMVMEPIPQEILETFQFPDHLSSGGEEKEEF